MNRVPDEAEGKRSVIRHARLGSSARVLETSVGPKQTPGHRGRKTKAPT